MVTVRARLCKKFSGTSAAAREVIQHIEIVVRDGAQKRQWLGKQSRHQTLQPCRVIFAFFVAMVFTDHSGEGGNLIEAESGYMLVGEGIANPAPVANDESLQSLGT